MTTMLHAQIVEQLSGRPERRWVLERLLDRRDAQGRFPSSFTLRCPTREHLESAREIFSHRWARPRADDPNVIIVNTKAWRDRLEDGSNEPLEPALYRALGRIPRDLRADRHALLQTLTEGIERLSVPTASLADALRTEALTWCQPGRRIFRRALEEDAQSAIDLIRTGCDVLNAIETNAAPVRLANFSHRALNSTKAFRPGTELYNLVTDALDKHNAPIRHLLDAEGLDGAPRRQRALEEFGIYRNETTVSVVLYAPITLEVRGLSLTDTNSLHGIGEPSTLMLRQLRTASITENRGRRIVIVENETTFNDVVEYAHTHQPNAVVICSRGNANHAVLQLLRLLHQHNPLPTVHWGDLDPYGIRILQKLRDSTGIDIRPALMDAVTLEENVASAVPLPESHEDLLQDLADSPHAPCQDLLQRIRDRRVIVEQEALAQDLRNMERLFSLS